MELLYLFYFWYGPVLLLRVILSDQYFFSAAIYRSYKIIFQILQKLASFLAPEKY